MSFVISTDTSANLPTAELQWHQLYLLPFSYIVNEVEHQCLDLSLIHISEPTRPY